MPAGGVGKVGVARERINQVVDRHLLGHLDLLLSAVADEDRLAAPHHGDRLADRDRREVHVGGGERQHVARRVHGVDEGPGEGAGAPRRMGLERRDEVHRLVRRLSRGRELLIDGLELARVDRLVGSAESISATVDATSKLAYRALSAPVIKTVAVTSGASRAARRLRGEPQRKR